MRFVEVIVNVPIRRTFGRQAQEGPPPDEEPIDGVSADPEPPGYQRFHYHLPPELEEAVRVGHLVWAPFGAREVQGFVVGFAESSPVPTKAVLRLARPDPVISSVQLELAQWLAYTYVAPLSEAIKLFLPPGLLTKDDGSTSVRAKRELQIRWAGGDIGMAEALARLGRETQQTRLLAWLLAQPDTAGVLTAAVTALGVTRTSLAAALQGLADKGLATRDGDLLRLCVAPDAAMRARDVMRGVAAYVPLLEMLPRCTTAGVEERPLCTGGCGLEYAAQAAGGRAGVARRSCALSRPAGG